MIITPLYFDAIIDFTLMDIIITQPLLPMLIIWRFTLLIAAHAIIFGEDYYFSINFFFFFFPQHTPSADADFATFC